MVATDMGTETGLQEVPYETVKSRKFCHNLSISTMVRLKAKVNLLLLNLSLSAWDRAIVAYLGRRPEEYRGAELHFYRTPPPLMFARKASSARLACSTLLLHFSGCAFALCGVLPSGSKRTTAPMIAEIGGMIQLHLHLSDYTVCTWFREAKAPKEGSHCSPDSGLLTHSLG
jgi:hypothetical protein